MIKTYGGHYERYLYFRSSKVYRSRRYHIRFIREPVPDPKRSFLYSYVILDEKVAVMDTIDERKTDEWFANLENVLNGRTVDYLVISHLEPDHAANIKRAADKFPQAQLVLSAKAKAMLPQFFDIAHLEERCLVVKEGDTLELGTHKRIL